MKPFKLHSKKLKIRQITKILGTFEASLPATKFGHMNMFYLQKCKNKALKQNKGNYEGFINLTENCISELQWWQKSVDSSRYLSSITSANNILRCWSKWLGIGGLLVESTQLGETEGGIIFAY